MTSSRSELYQKPDKILKKNGEILRLYKGNSSPIHRLEKFLERIKTPENDSGTIVRLKNRKNGEIYTFSLERKDGDIVAIYNGFFVSEE